jgi:hypothetical protein
MHSRAEFTTLENGDSHSECHRIGALTPRRDEALALVTFSPHLGLEILRHNAIISSIASSLGRVDEPGI